MERAPLQLKRLHPEAFLPRRMTSDAAGFDLCACLPGETVTLRAGERALIPTGWALAIPSGFEGQVRPRSGLAWKHGITIPNAPGTIDADYRGELRVILMNAGQETVEIAHGERIAQLVIARVEMSELEVVEELPESGRGAAGFGSTGR